MLDGEVANASHTNFTNQTQLPLAPATPPPVSVPLTRTSLSSAVAEGAGILPVASLDGFQAGDSVEISSPAGSPSGPQTESNTLIGIGNMQLLRPLKYAHPAGSVVAKLPQTPIYKVVSVLAEMKLTIEEEVVQDESTNRRMGCWCFSNKQEYSLKVADGAKGLGDLKQEVDRLKAKSTRLKDDLAAGRAQYAEDQKTLEEMKVLREKQTTAFVAVNNDLTEMIESVRAALQMLIGHAASAALPQIAFSFLTVSQRAQRAGNVAGEKVIDDDVPFQFGMRSSAERSLDAIVNSPELTGNSDATPESSPPETHQGNLPTEDDLSQIADSTPTDHEGATEPSASSPTDREVSTETTASPPTDHEDSTEMIASTPTDHELSSEMPASTPANHEVANEMTASNPAPSELSSVTTASVPAEPPASEWSSVDTDTLRKAVHSVQAFLALKNEASWSPGMGAQGGVIVGILKRMDEQMTNERAKARDTESQRESDYQSLKSTMETQMHSDKRQMAGWEREKAENDVKLSDDEKALADIGAVFGSNSDSLAELNQKCKEEEIAYHHRQTLRKNEADSIVEALKVLTEPEAVVAMNKVFGTSTTFLQVASKAHSRAKAQSQALAAARRKAAALLVDAAQKTNSPQLILMATSVQREEFREVKKAIDLMIDQLKEDQQTEEDEYNGCERGLQRAEKEVKTMRRNLKVHKREMKSLDADIARMNAKYTKMDTDVAKMTESLATAKVTRAEEREAYFDTTTTQRMVITVLNQANNVLKKFYEREKEPETSTQAPEAGEPEKPEEPEALVQKIHGDIASKHLAGMISAKANVTKHASLNVRAANDTSASTSTSEEDQAVPISAQYKEQSGVSAMSIIEMLIYSSESLLREAEEDEKQSQETYDKLKKDIADSKIKYKLAMIPMWASIVRDRQQQVNMMTDLNMKETLLATAETYYNAKDEECGFLVRNFVTSQQARALEIEALWRSKQILNGATFT